MDAERLTLEDALKRYLDEVAVTKTGDHRCTASFTPLVWRLPVMRLPAALAASALRLSSSRMALSSCF